LVRGIGNLLIVSEWVITRLILYVMVLRGVTGGYGPGYGADGFSEEMSKLYCHMSWMIGIAGLAIVSRMPEKRLK